LVTVTDFSAKGTRELARHRKQWEALSTAMGSLGVTAES
jgi:hypothetical protein